MRCLNCPLFFQANNRDGDGACLSREIGRDDIQNNRCYRLRSEACTQEVIFGGNDKCIASHLDEPGSVESAQQQSKLLMLLQVWPIIAAQSPARDGGGEKSTTSVCHEELDPPVLLGRFC